MKNELATTTSTEQTTEKQLVSFLDVMGLAPKLNDKEKTQFIEIAKMYNLNPFKREIYCTVYGTGDNKQFSIITGYEVYLKRAERSGQLSGWGAVTSGSVATGDLKATVTIYRKDREHPFIWEAFYDECVQTTAVYQDGKKTNELRPTKFWEKARFMTKKVCIAQGFRLCFNDELGGMPYTADEILQEEVTYDIPSIEVKEPTKKAISEKQLQGAITRIENGETGIIENVLNTFELTTEQHQKLITTKQNATV